MGDGGAGEVEGEDGRAAVGRWEGDDQDGL